jgi:uncharacterized protein with NRDE domain
MHRAERGTWLGVTRGGRIAALTNFREEDGAQRGAVTGERSRGAIVNAFLRMGGGGGGGAGGGDGGGGGEGAGAEWRGTTAEAAHWLVRQGLAGVGGFSLMLGQLRRPDWQQQQQQQPHAASPAAPNGNKAGPRPSAWEGLAIVSNRARDPATDVPWLCRGPGETRALSNAHYADASWAKVRAGEELVAAAVRGSAAAGEGAAALRRRLLAVLARDTLPPRREGEPWGGYIGKLRESIFIPLIEEGDPAARVGGPGTPLPDGAGEDKPAREAATGGTYATQKQSVILVDWDGKVSFFERTLFDERGAPVELGKGDREYEFQVEGWD